LTNFINTIGQTFGPEGMMQYLNADEAIKRLAAAMGIDALNLVKSMDERNQEAEANQQAQQQQAMLEQSGQMMNSPMMDPSKNPKAPELFNNAAGAEIAPPNDQPPM
jgi:hypothetical protein